MPRQDTWDGDGSNTDFKPAFVLEAEPLRHEGTPKSHFYPRPAPLVGYEASVSSMILGLGRTMQDPRLSLAGAFSNVQPGLCNLFTRTYFGPMWAQWLVTGPPDDAEEFQKMLEMNGLYLALAHFAWKGKLPGLFRVFQML